MHVKNTLAEYGLISKLMHWLSAILLLIQIPLGFYLVDLDFGEERITIENIHVLVGLGWTPVVQRLQSSLVILQR